MAPNDDGYAQEVIRTVAEMTRKLEQYQRTGDEARTKLQETVEGIMVQLRKDVHTAIISLQMNDSQHKDEHIVERNERAADTIQRANRQWIMNIWLGALTGLVVLILILLTIVVVRVITVWLS